MSRTFKDRPRKPKKRYFDFCQKYWNKTKRRLAKVAVRHEREDLLYEVTQFDSWWD